MGPISLAEVGMMLIAFLFLSAIAYGAYSFLRSGR
jgi:hypothetical protein